MKNYVMLIISCLGINCSLSAQSEERTELQKKMDVAVQTIMVYRNKALNCATTLIEDNKPLLTKVKGTFNSAADYITQGVASLEGAWKEYQRKRDKQRIEQLEQDLITLREKHSSTNQLSFLQKFFTAK
jgi:hypothetical protein